MSATSEPSEPKPQKFSDSFFGWDQLLLLLTPVLPLLVRKAAYILGSSAEWPDSILGAYFWTVFGLSFSSFFLLPLMFAGLLLWFIARHLRLRRFKRLAIYAIVLVAIPVALKFVDADYWKFVLEQKKYETMAADYRGHQAPHSARCMLFEYVEDRFYIGGMNFEPYERLILFVSPDIEGQQTPRIDSFSSIDDKGCRGDYPVRNIRHLRGRFYFADTYHG